MHSPVANFSQALLGFLLALSPLSCDLMGWRGAGGNGIASIGAYYFMGGLLMLIGGVLEFFLGNTFPFVVFCSFVREPVHASTKLVQALWNNSKIGRLLVNFCNYIGAYLSTSPLAIQILTQIR